MNKLQNCITAAFLSALTLSSFADADMNQDNVLYKDGKMQQTKSGKVFLMEKDLKTDNGFVITRDGNVVAPDGSVTKLKNGQVVSMDGKIMDHGNTKLKKDGFRMHDGKIYATVGGSENVLKEDTTLANGTKVSTKGEVLAKDGTSMKLSEGQKLDMAGMLVKHNGRDSDHARIKDGKVIWSEAGKDKLLEDTKTLGNGTKLMLDGSIRLSDGTVRQLKEGDLITTDGEVIEAEKQ